MKNDLDKNGTQQPIIVISIGRHTRLGDALEYALEGLAFENMEIDTFLREDRTNRRLLFASSTDGSGENAQMRALAARLATGEIDLGGSVCAMIVDCEQGGGAHLDAIRLLLAANAAGAEVVPRPLLEADRELRSVELAGGRGTPFERYQAAARALLLKLSKAQATGEEQVRVRFDSALEGGAAHDWRDALSRIVLAAGGELTDDADAGQTILLCENTDGLPDERTLELLCAEGKMRFFIASPASGSELYVAALIERACLRGKLALPARAIVVFEGRSAVEALASKAEIERVKHALH